MTNLIPAPPRYDLPLSKGGDLFVVFIHKPMVVDGLGDPVLDAGGNRQFVEADYPEDATVALIVDETADEPIVMDASIAGSSATVWEDKAVVDAISKGRLWRAVLTYPDGHDIVICNGTTVRADGKSA